jgi:hypothetical protein
VEVARRRFGLWTGAAVVLLLTTAAAAQRVAADAAFRPDPHFLERFHTACDGYRGAAFDECFVGVMAQAGASPAALAFARRLDGQAYLARLEEPGGPVALGQALYPFRANENEAWLILDGSPSAIDVDDQRYLPMEKLRADVTYREIARRYPHLTFWPGDRSRLPEAAMGGQQIIVDYLLRDVCHACAIVGYVQFAFNFDHAGRFLGARLASVAAADR